MLVLFLVCGLILIILLANEWVTRRLQRESELSRKFVHISVGVFVAFWPLFLSWNQIVLMSVAFLVVNIISKRSGIFKAIHDVERKTWGELLFAVTVGLVAVITHEPWIFSVAILHLALADGLAAVVGHTYGRKHQYKVFRHTKSILGSVTFLILSLGLLSVYGAFSGNGLSPGAILPIALIATVLENVSIRGLDNVTVPAFVALILNALL